MTMVYVAPKEKSKIAHTHELPFYFYKKGPVFKDKDEVEAIEHSIFQCDCGSFFELKLKKFPFLRLAKNASLDFMFNYSTDWFWRGYFWYKMSKREVKKAIKADKITFPPAIKLNESTTGE